MFESNQEMVFLAFKYLSYWRTPRIYDLNKWKPSLTRSVLIKIDLCMTIHVISMLKGHILKHVLIITIITLLIIHLNIINMKKFNLFLLNDYQNLKENNFKKLLINVELGDKNYHIYCARRDS